jgi:hypothetical protein
MRHTDVGVAKADILKAGRDAARNQNTDPTFAGFGVAPNVI